MGAGRTGRKQNGRPLSRVLTVTEPHACHLWPRPRAKSQDTENPNLGEPGLEAWYQHSPSVIWGKLFNPLSTLGDLNEIILQTRFANCNGQLERDRTLHE